MFEPKPNNRCAFVIDQDILQSMKIDVLNSTYSFSWDGVDVPIIPREYWDKTKIVELWKQENNSSMDDAELVFARQLEEAFAMKNYPPPNMKPLI